MWWRAAASSSSGPAAAAAAAAGAAGAAACAALRGRAVAAAEEEESRSHPPWSRKRHCRRLYIVLNENFHHTFKATADHRSLELRAGALEDKRTNPRDFARHIMIPIVDSLLARPEPEKVCWTGKASWANSIARFSGTRGVVDIGSSKSECAQVDLAGQRSVQRAPPLIEPLVHAKAHDFDIQAEGMSREELLRAQYEKVVEHFVRFCDSGAALVATEGVRSFACENDLPFDRLSVHEILRSPKNPMSPWYNADASRDVSAWVSPISPSRASGTLHDVFRRCPIKVLSGREEGWWEFSDEMSKGKVPDPLPEDSALVFISMGGSSTQVVVVDDSRNVHIASFLLGKNYFRQAGEQGVVRAKSQREEMLRFVNDHLGV